MDQPKKKHEEATVARLATAVQRPNLSPGHPVHRTRHIAVDLGEGVGRDETAIVVRDSDGVIDFVSGSDLCLASAAEETARFARIYHVDVSRISYDGVGVGRTFHNYLAKHGLADAGRYAGADRPREPRRFVNLRGEAAWRLRERLNPDRQTDDRYPFSSRQISFHIPARAWYPLLKDELHTCRENGIGQKVRSIKQ